jgi:hypothetical protein
MILHNKKGMQIVLASIIVALIALFIFLMIPKIIEKGIDQVKDRYLCSLSVEAKALAKGAGTFLNCPVYYSTITDDALYISKKSSEKGKEFIDFSGMSKQKIEDSIKLFLAEELYGCWTQFEAGQKDFLSDVDWGSSDERCFPCDIIRFDNTNLLDSLDYTSWDDFLRTKKIDSGKASGTSYRKAIYDSDTLDIFQPSTMTQKIKRTGSNQIEIYFVAKKKKGQDWRKFLSLFLKTDMAATAVLVNPKDMSGNCDRFY